MKYTAPRIVAVSPGSSFLDQPTHCSGLPDGDHDELDGRRLRAVGAA
jgi:hypothetical protein